MYVCVLTPFLGRLQPWQNPDYARQRAPLPSSSLLLGCSLLLSKAFAAMFNERSDTAFWLADQDV